MNVRHNRSAASVTRRKRVLEGGRSRQLARGERSAKNFLGAEDLFAARGVTLTVLQDPDCIALMERFVREKPDLWNEDIGEPDAPPSPARKRSSPERS